MSFFWSPVAQTHVVILSQVNANGWVLGQANEKVGWFPGDFVAIRASASEREEQWCAKCLAFVSHVDQIPL